MNIDTKRNDIFTKKDEGVYMKLLSNQVKTQYVAFVDSVNNNENIKSTMKTKRK